MSWLKIGCLLLAGLLGTAAAAAAVQVAQAAQLRSMQAPSVGGIAHGGLDYVPKETTFLLDEGERVSGIGRGGGLVEEDLCPG